MWTWRSVVHICVGYSSITHSFFEYFHSFFGWRDILLSYILNVNSFGLVLPYFQIIFWGIQQISDFLHVYFDHAYFDSKLQVIWTLLYSFKNRINTSRQETFHLCIFTIRTNTSKCFTWRSLTIGENCTIDSLKCWIDNGLSNSIKDIFLLGFWTKNVIKTKPHLLFPISFFFFDSDVLISLVENKGRCFFSFLVGSYSNKNSDCVFLFDLHQYYTWLNSKITIYNQNLFASLRAFSKSFKNFSYL